MASDKPTPAQVRYLVNVRRAERASTMKLVCFPLWSPGPIRTGQACLDRGWVSWGVPNCLHELTPAGRAIAERAISDGVEG